MRGSNTSGLRFNEKKNGGKKTKVPKMPPTKWRPGPPLTAATEVARFVPAADWLAASVVPPLPAADWFPPARFSLLPWLLSLCCGTGKNSLVLAIFCLFLGLFSTFLRAFSQRCARVSAWSCCHRSLPLLCGVMEAAGPPRGRDGGRARGHTVSSGSGGALLGGSTFCVAL